MASAIDMSSNALLLIGDEPISSFNDPGAGARAAAALYPETKQMILSYHPWSFALKERVLSRLSQEPDDRTGYKYAFTVPTDAIRLWEVFPRCDYVIVGELLYSNEPALMARYVFNVDETMIPPHLVKAIEYQLASEFAISVTEDDGKAQLYERKSRDQLAKASNVDSMNRPQESIKSSPFIEARFRGSPERGYFY